LTDTPPLLRVKPVSELDARQTIIQVPGQIEWQSVAGTPSGSVEQAVLSGGEAETGQYLVLMKWYPGFMSAPHSYRTDRLCVVLSGVWWCNSGADFDPDSAVAVPAGSFVKRVAGTSHYDGARRDAPEPAVIAISGIGPVDQRWVDPAQPRLRRV
jgi:hypothetical protein